MQGKRVADDKWPENSGEYSKLVTTNQDGEYGKVVWFCIPPKSGIGCGSLSSHTVVEHEDGTITVSPSILIYAKPNQPESGWHGYLERGIWREY